jgi:hypothetical protein
MKPSLVLAVSLLAAAGCKDGPPVVQPPPPGSQALQEDLPAPHGFELKDNQTHTNPTGAFRVVKQYLQGRNRKIDYVVGFYEETFPKHGWTLEKKGGDLKNGPASLSFLKKDERCDIEVKDETSATVGIRLNVTRK